MGKEQGGMMIERVVPFAPRAAIEPALRWFVLVILSGLERIAKMHLDELSVGNFLPLVETERTRPARGRSPDLPYIVVPRFPGYLFVHLTAGDRRWHSVHSARGVLHALATEEGRPIPVPAPQIDRWLAMADKDGIVEHWRAPAPISIHAFEYGSMVRIKSGPFFSPNEERAGLVFKQRGERVSLVIADKRLELRWDQIEEVL
jgi:transcription antitermination factor NusG